MDVLLENGLDLDELDPLQHEIEDIINGKG